MCNRKTYGTMALLALAVLTVAGGTVWADPSLVGWWPLDEGSGTVAKDASGNGFDGTFKGEPLWTAGRFGSALTFDGKDDYVDTTFTQNLGNWTVGCWVQSPAAPASASAAGPIHRESNFQINWNHTNATFRGAAGVKVGSTWYGASFGTLGADTWYHLAATYDGENLKAYTNGQLITNNDAPSGPAANETNTLKLGRHASSATQFFTGTVDDARVYNRALSQKELLSAMNNYSIDPVGWWKFDETSGTTAVDSAAGNNGTLLGNPTWVAGKVDGALQFDGDGDYVDLPIGNLISKLSDTTVTAWVNWSGTGGIWQRIFDFGSNTGVYMFLSPSTNAGTFRFAIRTATVGEQVAEMAPILPTGWHHVAVTIDSTAKVISLYLDGARGARSTTTLLPKDMGVTTQNWLGRSQWPDPYYNGVTDELRIYDRVLTGDEVANVMQGGVGFGVANTPSPANKATNLLPDVSLSWKAGQLGQTHDVYLGIAADDVANATTAAPLNVLVSPGQTATTYNAGRLALGKTYYWRVDEVGAAPDFAVYKGNVWSFTVEPVGYTMGKASITATASSSNSADMGPEKTIDGSGLNASDQHSTKESDMWLSAKTGPQPTWIQYAFDKVYSLNNMLVWNSNQALEAVVGYGAKSVTVEYSLDGTKWSALGEFEFADAPGEDTYAANTTVDFGGVAAQFVKLTMNSNWGGLLPQYGLSEVRFSYIPVAATNPSPASGTIELEGPVVLSWRPGREAASHEVYLGTDKANLTLVATVMKTSFEATVELDKTYYWQVVEVNEARPTPRWPSDVWTFKTKELPKDAGIANLVALYSMEDNINDSAGTNLNGTLSGGPTFIDSMPGLGKALSVDGTDDYATLPIGNLINTLSSTTFAVWVNWAGSSTGSWQRILDFGSGTGTYAFLAANRSGTQSPRFAMRTATVGEQIVTSSAALPADWHHLAVSIDAEAMRITLFLDGAIVGSGATRLLPKDMGVTTQNWIARSQYAADAYYKGAVDDVRIYNKALSKGEVMYLAGLR